MAPKPKAKTEQEREMATHLKFRAAHRAWRRAVIKGRDDSPSCTFCSS